ncbi:MAG: DEAD/DEAH box helicase family protein [Nitrospira sp.]|nr:DEAD/DEAH box helicase family protein [Nitrospira sp.]
MTDLNKKSLSERDICTKFITPAVKQAGWDELSQIREEVGFTKGRIIVRGKLVTRGKAKRADYILYYKPNLPIALIEAKDNSHPVGGGMQQALVDRNVLIDQTMVNDFRPFGKTMAKLSTGSKTIERADGTVDELPLAVEKKHRRIDTSYEIYLGLYQAITGPEESDKLYRELSRNFFDLIVIDECHRGSAAADSAWREILDHFSSATQIGLTATPKETAYVSNIHYFGKPVFTYSLKEGIRDGFLAP